ncbi:CBS domain-containing protein [Legionella londiniensis]|uniref:IMP dehydrogenase n=1 Tax=Legionella londiniensis TaxID=45068 RepID=A0A0W0VLL2_9GAMM|nr:CBS domain-containing protein [Legionella londiniensis]KTD21029.1 IMP dehydrogenase [Legionella londiniensis]STX93696.1 IMP dehydrogenase [Legionella londiniensis]
MEIKEAMTENPTYCHPDSTLRELAKVMKSLDTGVIPIGDGEKLHGIVTDRDITLSLAEEAHPDQTKARDIMHKGVYYCYEEDTIEKAAQDMSKLQVRRLIVLDNEKNKKMVGILSIGDIARATHDKQTCGKVINQVSEERQSAH